MKVNYNFLKSMNLSEILNKIWFLSGTANSAAADGVGALKSETKSHKVISVSCPIAEIIGILDL